MVNKRSTVCNISLINLFRLNFMFKTLILNMVLRKVRVFMKKINLKIIKKSTLKVRYIFLYVH